ncbi:MAG: hypothetical protein ABIA78_01725 [archaeon]
MKLALLILDENASVETIALTYKSLNVLMREKHNNQEGLTVLANDQAILGKEDELMEKTNIQFLPGWQNDSGYRDLIRNALLGDDVYLMERTEKMWGFKKAEPTDYEISDDGTIINLKPGKR